MAAALLDRLTHTHILNIMGNTAETALAKQRNSLIFIHWWPKLTTSGNFRLKLTLERRKRTADVEDNEKGWNSKRI